MQHLWSSAYNQCLQFQIGDSQQQLYARCLGYLLQEAIDETSRDYVAAEIIRCNGDVQELNDLAKFYINHVFRLCELGIASRFHINNADISCVVSVRQNKGRTPVPSSHRSPDSFEAPEKSLYAGPVDSAPKDHSSSKKAVSPHLSHQKRPKRPTPFPRKALRRDGYRCMVIGGYDIGYTLTLPVTALDALLAAGSSIASTHLAHIFPLSTNKGINSEVYRYAHIDVQQELDGPQIHSLCNVLTLSTEMHNSFGDLMLWFEEVSVSFMLSLMLHISRH